MAWKPGVKGESVLATGSFDASAGIWRRWDGEAGAGEAVVEEDFTGSSGVRKRRGKVGGGEGDVSDEDGGGDLEEEEDEWRFAVILDGHESEIKGVAWSAGGQYLATCSRDKSVWIWEEMEDDNFETIAVLQEHEGDVKCVCWHPTEELLVSSSYDDTIRIYKEDLDDWACVGVLTGHDATVWCVDFEPAESLLGKEAGEDGKRKEWTVERERSGPRLVSSSDDLSIRIWRRKAREGRDPPTGQGRMPSIIRSNNIEEEWFEEAQLPKRHERAPYSVAWSKTSGRIVSTGSDGKLVIYEEQWKDTPAQAGSPMEGVVVNGETAPSEATEWVVLAEIEGAHDVFEINHVCWAKRRDRERKSDDEEMILTTGDDGEVKAWTLDGTPAT